MSINIAAVRVSVFFGVYADSQFPDPVLGVGHMTAPSLVLR